MFVLLELVEHLADTNQFLALSYFACSSALVQQRSLQNRAVFLQSSSCCSSTFFSAARSLSVCLGTLFISTLQPTLASILQGRENKNQQTKYINKQTRPAQTRPANEQLPGKLSQTAIRETRWRKEQMIQEKSCQETISVVINAVKQPRQFNRS
eukprot:GHVT01018898.1.p1 GENE.GHVT01018898.1~~GHVT01018898.1.p1  ORF type:complete len:154 (-),score=24.75 GHVT01018898.1:1618-2079(-)